MINPFNYCYYKLGKDADRIMVVILSFNVVTLYILIVQKIPSLIVLFIILVCVFIFFISYFTNKREKRIIEMYKKESEKSRIIGGFAVAVYIVGTLVFFVLSLGVIEHQNIPLSPPPEVTTPAIPPLNGH
jgi:O-antigen/teichoic acid export membrane protein